MLSSAESVWFNVASPYSKAACSFGGRQRIGIDIFRDRLNMGLYGMRMI
jgi:hypothetical protein